MTAFVLHGLLYATVTVVLLPSFRAFRQFNLAAGVWVLLGGWLGSFATASAIEDGTGVSPNLWYLIPIGAVGVLQIAATWRLAPSMGRSPLSYIFLTLGSSVAIKSLLCNYVLPAHNSQLPGVYDLRAVLWLLGICVLITITSAMIANSSYLARASFAFRLEPTSSTSRQGLLMSGALEACLLLLLGAVSACVHQGRVDLSEYLTVVPILSLLAADPKYWRAPIAAFCIPFIANLNDAYLHLVNAPSIPLVLIGLLFSVIYRNRPRSWRLGLRRNDLLAFDRRGVLDLHDGSLTILVVLATFVIATILLTPSAGKLVERFMFVCALMFVSRATLKYLGVFTISWPLFCSLLVYWWLWSDSYAAAIFAVVGTVLAMVLYLYILRLVSPSVALLIDLGITIALFHLISTQSELAGQNHIRDVNIPGLSFGMLATVMLVGAVVAVLVAIDYLATRVRQVRSHVIALSNPIMGDLNGFSGRSVFFLMGVLLAGTSAIASYVYFDRIASIEPNDYAPLQGLTCLLLGYVARWQGALLPLSAVFVVFVVLSALLSGSGVALEIGVGIAFMLTAIGSHLLMEVGSGDATT